MASRPITTSVSRTAVLSTSAARFSALVASLTNFEITMPDGMFSNVDDGQRSMRSNIVMRSSTSTPCEIRFSRYELANDARPRTTNRPTNAAGSHSTDALRSSSARSVMMPVSLASSGSVTAAIAVATSANPSTLRCTSTIRIRRRRFGSSSRRGWEGAVMSSRATIRAPRARAPLRRA